MHCSGQRKALLPHRLSQQGERDARALTAGPLLFPLRCTSRPATQPMLEWERALKVPPIARCKKPSKCAAPLHPRSHTQSLLQRARADHLQPEVLRTSASLAPPSLPYPILHSGGQGRQGAASRAAAGPSARLQPAERRTRRRSGTCSTQRCAGAQGSRPAGFSAALLQIWNAPARELHGPVFLGTHVPGLGRPHRHAFGGRQRRHPPNPGDQRSGREVRAPPISRLH